MQSLQDITESETAVVPFSSPRSPDAGEILVLGLGNDILTDDAIGLNVVRQLRESLADNDRIDVCETMEMGLALLDFIVGYRAVVIVDSIQTGQSPAGTIHEVDAAGLKQLTVRTPHFLGVGETLALGRQLGLAMPQEVRILAVEVEDPFTLGTEMTPALQRAIPAVLMRTRQMLRELSDHVPSCHAFATSPEG
ncbi:MAG: hydrogenase maturation protease [Verrucomicrobia bacterium]|jgi:hydrogenase maturation protease|nr:hydrogenase maturation protease [Verrucomicrobiota bacterium]